MICVRTALGCLVLVGAGCSAEKPEPKAPESGQSFKAAMELVCNVDRHIGVTDDSDPLELDQKRSDFLQSRVKNPDVIYHQTLWRVQSNLQRSKTIRDLSCQAELADCPYADALEQSEF